MDTTVKVWLIVGAALLVLGALLFTVVMSINHWNFAKLCTTKYTTNAHEIQEAFTDIAVNTDTSDILFGVSDDNTCQVVCREEEKLSHSVCVVDGVLTIEQVDHRKWYEHIGINTGHSQITVYLPRSEYGSLTVNATTADVALPRELGFENVEISLSTGDISSFAAVSQRAKFKASTGRIQVEGIKPEALDISVTTGNITVSDAACRGDVNLSVTTGKVQLTDMTCRNLCSTGRTGDLTLNNVTASGSFNLKYTTGDIGFTKCDASEILCKTTTGDVTGSLLSEKVFITNTSTGHVNVPQTSTGGKCQITTGTGDIQITVEE
jgi:DUF4097 and DUF4098 domain-containing protein YvlB